MRIARWFLTLSLALGITLALGGVASADAPPYNPPNGGAGDTPLNSEQAEEHAFDNFLAAVDASGGGAANALVRNPTCVAYAPTLHP